MKQERKTPYRNPSPPHTHFPCPRHPKQELKKRETTTTYGRWSYYKCPVPDCFACAGVDNIQCCVASSDRMLIDYYIQLQEMKCYCQRPLIMSMSRSEKNPGKFYFRCAKRQCDIFQWADEYPQTKVRAWLEVIHELAPPLTPFTKKGPAPGTVCLFPSILLFGTSSGSNWIGSSPLRPMAETPCSFMPPSTPPTNPPQKSEKHFTDWSTDSFPALCIPACKKSCTENISLILPTTNGKDEGTLLTETKSPSRTFV